MTTVRRSQRLAHRHGFSVTNLNDYDYEYEYEEEDGEGRRSRVSPPAARDPLDPTLAFLYRPHSIALLLALIGGLVWAAFGLTSATDPSGNLAKGVMAAAGAFLVIGVLQFSDGPFIRPHPVFWRAILSLSVLYLLSLIILLFQTAGVGRKWMAWIDPSLGIPLYEKTYADACALTWKNIEEKLDMFVPAHFFGWIAKALILRDTWICWIVSVMFEVLEYSLEFQLPNFAECWWDHWILDALICNWAGIVVGMWLCRKFACRTYHWRGIRDIPSIPGKAKRAVEQLTPHSWTSFDWATTRTFKGYIVTLLLVFFFLLSELNCFYLKALLWIPPPHWLNSARVILHGFMGMAGVRELYQYFSDPECKKLGAQLWVALAVICTETIICLKFGWNELPWNPPVYVVRFWALFSTLLVLYPIVAFWILPRRRKAHHA